MTTARFSHSQCPHPSTKAARAACRAALRAAAAPADTASKAKVAVAASAAAETAPAAAVAVAREETCTKCSEAYVTTAPEVIDVDPLCDDCTTSDVVTNDAATSSVEITTDTWREHKDKPASIYVVGVEESIAAQSITGYSIKFLQFTDSDGKRQRIAATTVERVTV
ncbi:hypothetical protein ABZ667_16110 [Streptomyces lavendulae]|uniref:hypothetical protein n=1 Tax=Streptomyces lavendulae TaxID=1914 RepID=UPI0033FD40A9